jgi:hypothetical protein
MGTALRRITRRGAVALTAGAALALSLPGAAVSAEGPSASRAVTAQQLTLRLASNAGQVANVSGGSQENGGAVIQWPVTRGANERWEPEALGGGWYRFRAVHSGKCLNVRGGGTADGTQVIQYTCGTDANEAWRFEPKATGYQLVVASSGKCLNVEGGVGQGRNLIQYTCSASGAANDVWVPAWEPVTV